MNLYLIMRTDEVDYDEHDGFVICAENEEAQSIAQERSNYFSDIEDLSITKIGISDSTEKGIVLESFIAG